MTAVKKPKEIRNHYPIRILAYTSAFFQHVLIYYEDPRFTPSMWVLLGLYSFLYPHLAYYFTKTTTQERRNLLFECALNSFYIVMWGFNETILLALLSIIFLTIMAASGIAGTIRAAIFISGFTYLYSQIFGFQYRDEIPHYAEVYSIIVTLTYFCVIGYVYHKVNRSLYTAKNHLYQQTESLKAMNELAKKVNSVLDVDALMKIIFQVIRRKYPIESVFVTAFDDNHEYVELIGTLSTYLNKKEHRELKKLKFSLRSDDQSFFLRQLIKDEVLYLPEITKNTFISSSPIDLMLYEAKPPKSLAYFPVCFQDKVIAGIAFINHENPLHLTPGDIETIEQYMLQIGVSLKNIRLLHRADAAKKRAEESEQAKSRFLANMSHEIRTPMTAILGYSEALQEDDLTVDEKKKFTRTVIQNGRHLLSIINDILDISKIEADKIEVEIMDVNLLMLIHELDDNIKLRAAEKNLSYSLEIQYPIPLEIRTDPTRLKQILLNLGSNAVKFTEQGSVKVLVKWLEEGTLEISIRDSGIGLSKEEQTKLFQPFTQADSSTTRLYGGTGLGLYISKNLIQIMGGDLVLDSEKGKGSEFTVLLDHYKESSDSWVNHQEEFDNYIAQEHHDQPTEFVPKLKGNVLVADDTYENQQLICHLIEKTGLKVGVVANGQEAVEHTDRNHYDIVFLDIQMPIMGGQEAAQIIHSRNSHLPLVAFTANVMKHQVDSYTNQRFVDVIEKPLAREKLYSLLRKYLADEEGATSVLIVDDNKVNSMVLSRYIEKYLNKAVIDHAEDGEQAITKVATHFYDIIFMDIEMPVMNGFDATERLREDDFKGPIYMVTGHTDKSHAARAHDVGATGVLNKPIDKAKLESLLSRFKGAEQATAKTHSTQSSTLD